MKLPKYKLGQRVKTTIGFADDRNEYVVAAMALDPRCVSGVVVTVVRPSIDKALTGLGSGYVADSSCFSVSRRYSA